MKRKSLLILFVNIFVCNQFTFFLPADFAQAGQISRDCLAPQLEIPNSYNFVNVFRMVEQDEKLFATINLDAEERTLDAKRQVRVSFNPDNNSVTITNADKSPTFSYDDAMTPARGNLGIFSVNTTEGGQQIVSVLVGNKENPIIEYQPKDRASEMVLNQGFGTFLKVKRNIHGVDIVKDYVPFLPRHSLKQKFDIESDIIEYLGTGKKTIRERNFTLGIEVEITYTRVLKKGVPLLAESVTVRKLPGYEQTEIEYEIVEGIRKIMSPGQNDWTRYKMSNTGQYFNSVETRGEITLTRARALDDGIDLVQPEPAEDELNNFFTSFSSDPSVKVSPVWDKNLLFGENNRRVATGFFETAFGEFSERRKHDQINKQDGGQHFSAMNFAHVSLGKGQKQHTIYSYYGQKKTKETLAPGETDETLKALEEEILNEKYFLQKRAEMDELTESLLYKDISIHSKNKKLNAWFAQSKLENYLRGGTPVVISKYRDKNGNLVVEYEDKINHADLSRDYNDLNLKAEGESDGGARDTLQYRTTNMLVDPNLAETDILRFLSLVQLDGYNPKSVGAGVLVYTGKEPLLDFLVRYVKGEDAKLLVSFLENGYGVRKLKEFIEKNSIKLIDSDRQAFMKDLIAQSEVDQQARFSEGYWQDHIVAYIKNFFKNYRRLIPLAKQENRERFHNLIFKNPVTTFESHVNLKPRYGENGRYILDKGKPMQRYVLDEEDKEKIEQNKNREATAKNKVHTDYGKGEVFKTSIFEKMLTLFMKIADLDSHGIGIDLKTGKNGWDDSLSMMAAYFGSSVRVTTDLYLLFDSWIKQLEEMQLKETDTIEISEERAAYFQQLAALLNKHVDNENFQSEEESLAFWDKSNDHQRHGIQYDRARRSGY